MTTTDTQRGSISQAKAAERGCSPGSPEWAAGEAEGLLAAELPEKWAHTQEVARYARSVARGVRPGDRALLVAAAYLHDIGYADALAATGFHPLDGAKYLHDRGLEELACLVAHHSGARIEAEARGLTDHLAWFRRPSGAVADALTYSDVTSGPSGEDPDSVERFEEIVDRHGADSVVAQSRAQARTEMYGMVARTLRRASRNRPQPEPVSVTPVGLGCVTLVRVEGELTEVTAARACAALDKVLDRAPHAVVIDMAMVAGLDSTGAAVLAAVSQNDTTVTLVDPRARDLAVLHHHNAATLSAIVYGIEPALAPHCF